MHFFSFASLPLPFFYRLLSLFIIFYFFLEFSTVHWFLFQLLSVYLSPDLSSNNILFILYPLYLSLSLAPLVNFQSIILLLTLPSVTRCNFFFSPIICLSFASFPSLISSPPLPLSLFPSSPISLSSPPHPSLHHFPILLSLYLPHLLLILLSLITSPSFSPFIKMQSFL